MRRTSIGLLMLLMVPPVACAQDLPLLPDIEGFARTVLQYDLKADQWNEVGQTLAPRVTVPCVAWDSVWIIPSGEVRPGIRSPAVTASLSLNKD